MSSIDLTDVTAENPNSYENSINNVVKAWAKLKLLMENPDLKNRGITQALLSGRPIWYEQRAEVSELARTIDVALLELAQNRPLTTEEQAAQTKFYEESVAAEKVRCSNYVSPFQEWINERMAEYIKTNSLSEDLLEGDVQCVRFQYNEVVKCYGYDSNEALVPIALVLHHAENGTDGSLMKWLVNQISESGDTYGLFSDIETHDSHVMESNVEWEKA
jgi:hypothetical protein